MPVWEVQDSERACWNQNAAKGCMIFQIVNRVEGDDDYDAEWVIAHQFVLATSYSFSVIDATPLICFRGGIEKKWLDFRSMGFLGYWWLRVAAPFFQSMGEGKETTFAAFFQALRVGKNLVTWLRASELGICTKGVSFELSFGSVLSYRVPNPEFVLFNHSFGRDLHVY